MKLGWNILLISAKTTIGTVVKVVSDADKYRNLIEKIQLQMKNSTSNERSDIMFILAWKIQNGLIRMPFCVSRKNNSVYLSIYSVTAM
jgi:hypothetical protein